MYPDEELSRLAGEKDALHRRSACHRDRCRVAADRLTRPLRTADRLLTAWRGLPLLARMAAPPLGLWFLRRLWPRVSVLPNLIRWSTDLFRSRPH